jgi:hypothetical protein
VTIAVWLHFVNAFKQECQLTEVQECRVARKILFLQKYVIVHYLLLLYKMPLRVHLQVMTLIITLSLESDWILLSAYNEKPKLPDQKCVTEQAVLKL